MFLRACLIAAWTVNSLPAEGQVALNVDGVVAHFRLQSPFVQVGEPVWAVFSLENTGDSPVTLTVPGVRPQIPSPEMGLPLSHIFSGDKGSGVYITGESARSWEMPTGYKVPDKAPIVTIAPHSVIGARVDLKEYFRVMRGIGVYRITWKPYGGLLTSEMAVVEVAPLKQADIQTDFGRMAVQFYYDEAPATVANFIDLARSSFYTNTTFHRLMPGYMILGGDPQGNGTGIRPDGKRLAPEFNSRPHKKGTLSMALADDDPQSASCQFFICNTTQKDWDGKYTVFGELIGDESYETLDKLMAVPTDAAERPTQTIYIRAVRIINAPYTPPLPVMGSR